MKNSRIVYLAIFAMTVFGGVETAFADSIYSFTTIDVPGATGGTRGARGINDSGQIVGSFYDGVRDHGFAYSGGRFTTIDVPGAFTNVAFGINNSGQIVGSFIDATAYHGFEYAGGSFTTIDFPGSPYTQAYGINDRGQIVGINVSQGFLDTGGSFTIIAVPGAFDTVANGINNSGQIVGYFDNTTGTHGFLDTGGSFITIDLPGANNSFAYGINDSSQIVGYFNDATGTMASWIQAAASPPSMSRGRLETPVPLGSTTAARSWDSSTTRLGTMASSPHLSPSPQIHSLWLPVSSPYLRCSIAANAPVLASEYAFRSRPGRRNASKIALRRTAMLRCECSVIERDYSDTRVLAVLPAIRTLRSGSAKFPGCRSTGNLLGQGVGA
jgi:probable HAF family extracellular repeat protein